MKKVHLALAMTFFLTILPAGNAVAPNNGSEIRVLSEMRGAEVVSLQEFWLSVYGNASTDLVGKDYSYLTRLMAKAQPDECYYGIGESNIYPFDFKTQDCSLGKPKVNESYVFGLTKSGDTLWFGTAPNMGCLVYGAIHEQGIPGELPAFETDLWVCEYGEGIFGQERGIGEAQGDWRPPSIYAMSSRTGIFEQKVTGDPLIWETLGLRSAGTLRDVVILAGPTVTGVGGPGETAGINMFAFHATTGEYLGSKHFHQYNNIRKWVVVDGVLYTGVLNNRETFPDPSDAPVGAVLRWNGDETNPFEFEVVGWVDGDAAELVEHEGRLFVSTWPDFSRLFEENYDYAGLWMSPIIGSEGLRFGDANAWKKVWSASDYEQDEITARMYNGGALASFDGYLYWGTTHAPLSAGLAHAQFYGLFGTDDPEEIDPVAIVAALLGTHRPISIFRGRDFGSREEEMQVLYGLAWMPAYVENPLRDDTDYVWLLLPNKMGIPLNGPAGFGNLYNTYTWTMAVYENALFVGTMDWSHMAAAVLLPVLLDPIIDLPSDLQLPNATYGADLYAFPSGQEVAIALSTDGLGNYGSYGIRTMVADDALYLGMANAMNLMTDSGDDKPEGGWELIRLGRR